jgi:hypothetical protein
MSELSKPQPGEYPAYAEMYFKWVFEDRPLIQQLQNNLQSSIELFRSMPEEKTTLSFAPGEWTVKEILGHMMDQERVLVYRALRFSRGDETELATFDHEKYVKYSRANQRPLDEMLDEFSSIRAASITFFSSLDDKALIRSGSVDGNRFSVRALAWLTVGHELHHLNSIKQNYL